LFDEGKSCDPDSDGSGLDREGLGSGGDQRVKKKKKRAKKKKLNLQAEEGRGERENSGTGSRAMQDLVCLYPFTSSSSAMQRRIKQQYEELVKCNETKRLTMAQVFYFLMF
jgi:predicted nucleotidyltransferase